MSMTWWLVLAPLLALAVPLARSVDRLRTGRRVLRHGDCLRRIEKLEVDLGLRYPRPDYSQIRYTDSPGAIFEMKMGAPAPLYFAPTGAVNVAHQQQLLQQQQQSQDALSDVIQRVLRVEN